MKKLSIVLASCMLLTGCMVDQSLNQNKAEYGERKIIATSFATMQILDKMGIDIVARAETANEIADRYIDVEIVGTAMSPDAEAIAMIDATHVIGPDTLIETIKPTYDAVGIEGIWLDLQSVEGMYESIDMLGDMLDTREIADELIADYQSTVEDFMSQVSEYESPKVLVLMGLPGAYIAATNNSYVGSMVELAGGENVVKVDTNENYVSWNTEAMIALDPDLILLTAHGLPEMAMDMFAEEFVTNDIWKNFRAVEEGNVFALKYENFGMSATFGWKDGFSDLMEILYDTTYESFVK